MSSRGPTTFPHKNGFSQASKPIALISEIHKLLSQYSSIPQYFLSDALAPFLQQDASYNLIPFECSALGQCLKLGKVAREAKVDLKLSPHILV